MKQLPQGSTGQALALAVALLGVMLVYLAVVSPVLGFYNDRADLLERRVAVAERYEALARELPALRSADKQWRDRSGGELLLDGSSDAIASAALQADIKGLVEEAGAKLSSSEVLTPSPEGNFRRVGVRVVFSGDLKLVTQILRGVETSRPVLSIGDFSLHTGGGPGKSGDSDDEDTAAGNGGTLAVTLDVYGYRAV
jgi:general secretion pathway protein M